MNLNKAFLIGNLTRDPELRSIPSGAKVASFGLATNRVWKDKAGQKQEDAQFHNIVVFGAQAEAVGQYLKRGNMVLVEGRIQTRSWDGQDGVKKYRTEIVAERVQFGPKGGSGGGAGGSFSGAASPSHNEPKDTNEPTVPYPDEKINPDDIPF